MMLLDNDQLLSSIQVVQVTVERNLLILLKLLASKITKNTKLNNQPVDK